MNITHTDIFHSVRSRFPTLTASLALRWARHAAKLYRNGLANYGERISICTKPSHFLSLELITGKATNPFGPWIGNTSRRWIESTERASLRFVGFADELANLSHTGWYTDDDGSNGETLRGAVWQLPARSGRAQYIAGYMDPNNDGAAMVDFDIIEGKLGGAEAYDYDSDSKRDTARQADGIAECAAETERDYQRMWQAAQITADELDTIYENIDGIETDQLSREICAAIGTAITAVENARDLCSNM